MNYGRPDDRGQVSHLLGLTTWRAQAIAMFRLGWSAVEAGPLAQAGQLNRAPQLRQPPLWSAALLPSLSGHRPASPLKG
jgi:hypothetical protein